MRLPISNRQSLSRSRRQDLPELFRICCCYSEFRQLERTGKAVFDFSAHAGLGLGASFCSDEDDTVSTADTVESSSGSVFEDRERLDVFGVDKVHRTFDTVDVGHDTFGITFDFDCSSGDTFAILVSAST